MPTFFFYKNRKKVDEMQGANPTGLEDRINQWIGGTVDTMVITFLVIYVFLFYYNSFKCQLTGPVIYSKKKKLKKKTKKKHKESTTCSVMLCVIGSSNIDLYASRMYCTCLK